MNKEARKAIIMMGYRQVRNNIFLKPVGHSCFAIKYSNQVFELVNIFGRDMNGDMAYWNSKKLDNLNITDIKDFELGFHPNHSTNTKFEFLTSMDYSILEL